MKVLSYQPFSLFENGGGSRILRRLYEGHESDITSLVVVSHSKRTVGNIKEIFVPAFPVARPWMRWKLRTFTCWLRENVNKERIIKQNQLAAAKISTDVIHAVNHGFFSAALCDMSRDLKIPLWASFHDHFSTCSLYSDAKRLWNEAERRLVISPELGREYQRLFGKRTFELVTDGVRKEEISLPKTTLNSPYTIYFAGLLHLDYYPLFEVLANALDALHEEGMLFKLILRGTQKLEFLKNRNFETEYRNNFLIDIKHELDSVDILYLPIKFNNPDFYLFSLSTKMVSYLGGRGSILYHGPMNSAACRLLTYSKAAKCCTTVNKEDLMDDIKSLTQHQTSFSEKAKKLARDKFELTTMQKRFWEGGQYLNIVESEKPRVYKQKG